MGKLHVWMPLVLTGTGSEVWTRRLTSLLRNRSHMVTMDEIPHHFQYAPWLAPVRCPDGADVTIANSWNAAAFQKGAPVVSVTHLVVHDPALSAYKSVPQAAFHRLFVKPMERAALRSAANVAVSQKVADQMRSTFGFDNCVVVRNGVDTEFFHPIETQKEGPLRLLFVGKPTQRKGFDLVTAIINQLGDAVSFTCVGERPDHGPTGNYTGFLDRDGVRAEFHKADLLLFPSRMEGLPLVVLEALACGIPVAGCRGTAVDEVVPPDAGIIEDAHDVEQFVRRIRNLTRSELADMSNRARQAAILHSETVWADQMEDVLQATKCR